jgi:hypothetical protein
MANEVTEGTTAYLTVTFYDKNGVPSSPSSLSYRIDDVTGETPTVVRADTAIGAADSVEITLTPADNAILAAANAEERRLVTVTATYGADDALQADYEYRVRNLRMVGA